MLSCSLVGSLALAAKFDPEDLAKTMRDFQDLYSTVITRLGGSFSIRAMDEFLAVFGHPEAHEDDAERAVHAGLDLVKQIGQLQSPANQPLQVRIGVATGIALVGSDQIVVGEPLGIAAGLRNLASPNSVLVAESTRRLLSHIFVCGNPARYHLAGATDAVNACTVSAKRTLGSRFLARHPEMTPLVGRAREMRQLFALWDRAKRGEGQVALVCGEPGIGKSHLCVALLDHIAEEPHATIRYDCSPHHHNSPFYPVISHLEQTIGLEQVDAPESKLAKIETVLFQGVKAARSDIPLFADLLSIPTTKREPAPNSTPRQHKDLIIAALIRNLLEIAGQRPLIIVLADIHWVDSSTLELVDRIISSIKKSRVLVLVQLRPEFTAPWLGEPHVNALWLDRLERTGTCAIISNVTGGRELPEEVQERIISKTDGVPLFVEELTKTVLESGLLEDVDDGYVVAGRQPKLAIPATLLDSLCARLDRLGTAKKVAQVGAAIGREFSYQLLAAVASESTDSLQAALQQIDASGLISVCGKPPEATYRFKHALVQDAAYVTLSRARRQQLHNRIADALENNFPHTIETQPDLLAHHLAEAGFVERAIEYLRKAGKRAIEASANPEAIWHLTRAIQLLQTLRGTREHLAFDLNLLLAQAMIVGRGYAAPETKQALLQTKMLMNGSTSALQKFSVLYGIWAGHYVGGEVAKQRISAAEFLVDAERQNDTAALCIAHRMLGTTCVTSGQFEAGLRYLEQAHALFDAEHHSRLRFQYGQDIGAAGLCYLSWALWQLGCVDQASNIADQAMRRAEELGHPHTLVYTLCHARGFMEIFRRRSEHLQFLARSVISLCAEHGLSHWMNFGRILEGWDTIWRGDVEGGIAVLQAGISGWQKAGARLWMPSFRMMEARAYTKAGRDDAALQTIDRAQAIAMKTGEHWAVAEVLRVKAQLLAATNAKAVQIETVLTKSVRLARRQRARSWELRASCDLTRFWRAQGRSKQATELLRSIHDQFTEGIDTVDVQEAKSLMESTESETQL